MSGSGCGGCGQCGECTLPLPNIDFCISDSSEIQSTLNCGCHDVIVDLCKMFTNGKFKSSDKSIEITTFPLPLDSDQCGLDFKVNLDYYINGNRVFCPDSVDPEERHLVIEGIGIDITFEGIAG